MLQISLGIEVFIFWCFLLNFFFLDMLVQGYFHFSNLCVIISLGSYSEVTLEISTIGPRGCIVLDIYDYM